ncbi:MAG TPA: hypothetical protein DF613_06020 [Lachnospiraceae bacterium]|nr:hypothetical protein [Lachnospiraceae bacterium]
MGEQWYVTVYGVRGSLPMAAADFLEYGGNTSCVCVDYGRGLAIFDAGSGLTGLGGILAGRKDIRRLDLLLTHLHLDHVMGLPGFAPLYEPDREIHLHGRAGFREQLASLLGNPWWPLELGDFPANLHFHEVEPGKSFCLAEPDGPVVSTLAGNHPGGSILYRLDEGGRRVVYALDCEVREEQEGLMAFARDGSLLFWDATFTPEDLREGWGHSTWEQGIALGHAAGVRKVLMTHYYWGYTDSVLREQERLARERDGSCCFAREGMVIKL